MHRPVFDGCLDATENLECDLLFLNAEEKILSMISSHGLTIVIRDI